MLDPVTLFALAIGVAVALGFAAVAAFVGGGKARRYRRRLATIASGKARSPDAAANPEARSLSRRQSATPGMDRFVKRWLPHRDLLDARLARTGRTITVGQYAVANGVLSVIAVTGMLFVAKLAVMTSLLVGLALGIGIPHFVIGYIGSRRVRAFIDLFPDAIDLIVRALRSGLPVSEAIISAAHEIGDPVGIEFSGIEGGMRMGRDLESLLWEIAKRIDSPEFRFFIIALGVQRETGGNLGETLANLSELLRRRKAMKQKTRAMSSEARASTMILGSLPVVVTLVLMLTSPHYIMTLFVDPRGMMLLALALGMLATGIGIMVKMAKFEI
ncbi:MAG TPA: type II secretion system F family protein [Stellaceae bacterium]|nr:type II secretion system F family protein [Stellaceae bacterium]